MLPSLERCLLPCLCAGNLLRESCRTLQAFQAHLATHPGAQVRHNGSNHPVAAQTRLLQEAVSSVRASTQNRDAPTVHRSITLHSTYAMASNGERRRRRRRRGISTTGGCLYRRVLRRLNRESHLLHPPLVNALDNGHLPGRRVARRMSPPASLRIPDRRSLVRSFALPLCPPLSRIPHRLCGSVGACLCPTPTASATPHSCRAPR